VKEATMLFRCWLALLLFLALFFPACGGGYSSQSCEVGNDTYHCRNARAAERSKARYEDKRAKERK